jgi:predicted O-methyltransferase YrrM
MPVVYPDFRGTQTIQNLGLPGAEITQDPGIAGWGAGRQPQPMTTDDKTAARHVPGTTDESPSHRPAGTEERRGGQVDPSEIMQVGMGFWASKTLLSAVELELFTKLGGDGMTAAEIAEALGLHERAVPDFPDTLVALQLLDREGDGSAAVYRNTDAGAAFLDKASPAYIGGILEMSNARLYRFWGDLTVALRTGEPQNEIKHTGKAMFEELYRDEGRLEQFMNAMAGISAGAFHALAEKFDFSKYETLCDVGGATGQLSSILANRHPHMRCTTFDLPVVEPIAKRTIEAAGLSDRVEAVGGDFFGEPLPEADVITMGMILHDWNLERKKQLVKAAYDALPEGGAYIVIENLIDDARRENAFGLLMSLNMLIEFGDAFDFTGADLAAWCEEAGFREIDVLPLAGPTSAGIAYK